jgi:hypothetical protein
VENSRERDHDAWQVVSDRALVLELRRASVEAVDEFIRRFEPLVARYAQLLQVPPAERTHWVGELLYDVAITLGRGRGVLPRHLGAYVAGACKMRVREQRAREATYRAGVHDALDEISGTGQKAAVGLCSESSLRDARGPASELSALSPVLQRLVSAFEDGVTPEEHTLLRWLGGQISYTMIADWLGISRPAAVSRIQRLRVRLIKSALRFGAALDGNDRVEFLQFLRRTGAVGEEQILALERSGEDSKTVGRPVARGDARERGAREEDKSGSEEDPR